MLSYCPTDWYGMSEICDYRNSTVKETWQSLYYDNLRNEHLNNNFKQCKFCKNCPDWKYTKWPHHKEKSYADLVERLNEKKIFFCHWMFWFYRIVIGLSIY